MNKIIILISICMLPFFGISKAQSTNECCQKHTPAHSVKKGYYSIGNNAQKLSSNTGSVDCCDSMVIESNAQNRDTRITKGYYAVGNNSSKLPVSNNNYTKAQTRPEVKKGYYAIGNNSQKLGNSYSYVNNCCSCNCK